MLSLVHILGQMVEGCCLWFAALLPKLFDTVINGFHVFVNGLNVVIGSVQGIHDFLRLIHTHGITKAFVHLQSEARGRVRSDETSGVQFGSVNKLLRTYS